jgi:autotransporter translocation and assembly factor TamB
VTIDDDEDEDDAVSSDTGTVTGATSALSCTRNMTTAELADQNDAVSGTVNISAEFASGLLTKVALTKNVVTSDDDAIDNEPVDLKVEEATADELTATSALNYYLPIKDDGTLDLTFTSIKANYESLDFTCDAL